MALIGFPVLDLGAITGFLSGSGLRWVHLAWYALNPTFTLKNLPFQGSLLCFLFSALKQGSSFWGVGVNPTGLRACTCESSKPLALSPCRSQLH